MYSIIPGALGAQGSQDGGWGEWSSFSDCSATCGDGQMQRTRACDTPPTNNGGKICDGNALEKATCNRGICPTPGNYKMFKLPLD